MGQAAWDAARLGRLHHLHLNDTQLPIDIGTIFASHHFWECLELLYWLREADYAGFLGIDCFWWQVDSALNAAQQVHNIHFMLRVLDALDDSALPRGDGRTGHSRDATHALGGAAPGTISDGSTVSSFEAWRRPVRGELVEP